MRQRAIMYRSRSLQQSWGGHPCLPQLILGADHPGISCASRLIDAHGANPDDSATDFDPHVGLTTSSLRMSSGNTGDIARIVQIKAGTGRDVHHVPTVTNADLGINIGSIQRYAAVRSGTEGLIPKARRDALSDAPMCNC